MAKALSGAGARTLLNKLIADAAGALTIAGATNASPSVVNVTAHGLSVGDVIFVVGTTGNTAINGLRKVATVPDSGHFTMTDFFTGSAVNGNGTTGGSPTATRVKSGLTPDDCADLIETMNRTSNGPGRIKDSSRPSATLETTIAVTLGQ